MKPRLATLVVSLALLTGASADARPILRPSTVNSNPESYDGKTVTLRGVLFFKFPAHERFIYDSRRKAREEVRYFDKHGDDTDFDPDKYDKYCITVANPDVIDHDYYDKTTEVTVRGRFIAKYVDKVYWGVGGCLANTAIEIEKILESSLY